MMAKKQEDPLEYLAKKDYRKAIALYRERLAEQPNNVDWMMGLADALLASRQEEEAIAQYRQLAEVYTHAGFLVKAIAVYKKILRIRPGMKEVEELMASLSDKRDVPPSRVLTEQEPQTQPVLELETRLFRGLTEEEFREVVSMLKLHHYEQDTVVVMEGDPGDSLFIVVRGQVRVLTRDSQQKEMVLANLGEGEFFGEVSLITGKPRTATIITNLDSELLELTRQDYETIVARHPHIKQVLEEFHEQRAYKTIEAMIQAFRGK